MYTEDKTTSLGNTRLFLRLNEILRLIPVSQSSWWRGVKSGIYPKSVKLAPRTTAWKESDIKDLINKINKGD